MVMFFPIEQLVAAVLSRAFQPKGSSAIVDATQILAIMHDRASPMLKGVAKACDESL